MKILLFIKANDGNIYYKCDTFWTISQKLNNAKVYTLKDDKEIDKLLTSFDYNIKYTIQKDPEKEKTTINMYNGAKMGYRYVDESLLTNGGYTVPQEVEDKIGELIYTHKIIFEGNTPVIDRCYIREEKIDDILK